LQALGSGKQIGWLRLKGVGDLPDGPERRALGAALDLAEVGAVDAAGEGGRFLAEASFLAEFAQCVSEGLGEGGFSVPGSNKSFSAERVGFEPTRRVNPAHAISSRAP